MKMNLLVFALAVLTVVCCKNVKDDSIKTHENLIENRLAVLVDSCWNQKDMEKLSSITTQNFTRNLNGIDLINTEKEMEAHMNVFFRAFPDFTLTLNDTYIKDALVFTHWEVNGTNTGIFAEAPATGKKINITGFSRIYFNEQGKIYREDVYYNELDLLQQLGYTLVPPVLE
ncbi:ester cyclase [Flavobacteriaceae bacterium F89]|uniref:Ester cyclase n=1 Tax=Cerina litoralis TaxID=2874477 RepID=A0AAE3EQL3_9FLAO|nr:ester cyclase [Cerina litoralis]MCG2459275.1 ester cyclase [Cerina litoralis]